jgi:hypothetical protein
MLSVMGRALAVWSAFIVMESILGTLRTLFLEPRIGAATAKAIGLFIGCVVLLLITGLTIPWIRVKGRPALLAIGLFWAMLTFAFELALGRALGRSWQTLLADYDPTQGGLMWLAMMVLVIAPLACLAARRGLRN